MSFEPQPTLAWQFESSNVESVQGIVPRAQVSPGPAQLLGSAALITNSPTVGDAVYFPGTTGSYMNPSSSAIVNLAGNSNIFVECWVYQMNRGTPFAQGIIANSQTSQQWILRISGGTPSIYIGGGPATGGSFTSGIIPLNTWTHLAFSWVIGPTSNTAYCFTNGIAAGSFTMTSLFTSDPGTSPIIGSYNSGAATMNGYIHDIRIVKGGVVPTASFPLILYPDPFAYTLPSYVTGTGGSVVFTLLGQFVTYPAGKFNKCLRLNNGANELNSRIEYSSLTSTLNNFSIAAWVYPYSVNTARTNTFFEMKPLVTTGTQFQVSAATTGKSTVAVSTNGGSLTELNSVANLTLGKWTHHCLTFSNVGATIVGNVFASYYINGTLQASSNASTQASSLLSNLTLGSTTSASADSGLDDFRVYDRTLTSTEVNTVYLSFGDPAGPKTYAAGVSSNVTTDGDGYTTHTFTTPGTFTCLRPGVADVLVVAGGGGGGGGQNGAGGGGAGGVQYFPNYYINQGAYNVSTGNGGTGSTNGIPSQFLNIVAIGGGAGAITGPTLGIPGGSGGGGSGSNKSGGVGTQTQGNPGGTTSGGSNMGAGGGGAGSSGTGTLSTINLPSGPGGVGILINGSYYGGGGGGGCPISGSPGIGGLGGGGPGGITGAGTPGTPGTGGGGGGGATAGNGGPGIVMIRYLTQGAPQGYETVYTGETTIGSFAGYNSPTANVQVFHGPTSPGGSAPYTWVKPSTGTFARVECVAGGGGGSNTTNSITSCIVKLFMNDLGTLANNNTLSVAQMTAIGISYTGSITTSNVTNINTNDKSLNITTTGSPLVCTVVPQPAGTVLNTTTGSSGTISGVYVRGNGGGGGGYSYATLPIADLPATVAVSVGGGGAAVTIGTASVFGPVTSPSFTGSVTASSGTTTSTPTNGGSLGIGFGGVAPSNIVSGGGGLGYIVVTSPTAVVSGYGGGGGGNGLVAGGASLFAGKGGDGAPATGGVSANQDGEYPGGGGGGGLSPVTITGGRGAAGRVRIIVY